MSARLIAKSIPGDRMPIVEKSNVRDVSQERMTSVIWTTALGLPIVQPYRKAKKKQVMTALQSVFISDPNLPTQVDPMKQSAAFPPNFVHSLDATHMMLTALECRVSRLAFVLRSRAHYMRHSLPPSRLHLCMTHIGLMPQRSTRCLL
jgi:DNA-directed RNA polymerase